MFTKIGHWVLILCFHTGFSMELQNTFCVLEWVLFDTKKPSIDLRSRKYLSIDYFLDANRVYC